MTNPKRLLIPLMVLAGITLCFGWGDRVTSFGIPWKHFVISKLLSTSNGTFMAGGPSYGDASGAYGFMIMNLKPNGDTLWTRTYNEGRDSETVFGSMIQLRDGNVLFSGTLMYRNVDIALEKIKPNGDIVWAKRYGSNPQTNYYYNFTDMLEQADGSIIIAGTASSNVSPTAILVFKTGPGGDLMWMKHYGGVKNDEPVSLVSAGNGNVILVGHNTSARPSDIWLLLLKPDGDTLYSRFYGGDQEDGAVKTFSGDNGNFFILGNTASFVPWNGWNKAWLLMVKPDCDTLWTRTYGHNNNGYAIKGVRGADGYISVLGQSYYFSEIQNIPWLFQIDPSGNMVWEKPFPSIYTITPTTIFPKSPRSLLVGGVTQDPATLRVSAVALRFGAAGEVQRFKQFGSAFEPIAFAEASNGNYMLAANGSFSHDTVTFVSFAAERYAFKDSLFTYKNDTAADSLNHGYLLLYAPPGMKVSAGGTIYWTPATDSSWDQEVECLVTDDYGNKDTCTFDLIVNGYKGGFTGALEKPARKASNSLTITTCGREVRFEAPCRAASIEIFDITGKLLQKLVPPQGNATRVAWDGRDGSGMQVCSGRYVARVTAGTLAVSRAFVMMR